MIGLNYKPKDVDTNWLQDGEEAVFLLLQRVPITRFKKVIDEANKSEREQAEALGMEYKPKPYSYKENGIAWDFAVIKRSKNGTGPNIDVFDFKAENPDPGIKFTGRIEMLSLNKLLEFPNSFLIYGGNGKKRADAYPEIDKLLPNPYVCKDWKTGTLATEVFDNPGIYGALVENEKKRLKEWDATLSWYNGLSEEEAIDELESHLAQIYLMYDYEDDGSLFLRKPQKGLTFRGKIAIENGKYLKPVPWKTKNKITQYWWGPSTIDSHTKALADDITNLIEKGRQEYLQNKIMEEIDNTYPENAPF